VLTLCCAGLVAASAGGRDSGRRYPSRALNQQAPVCAETNAEGSSVSPRGGLLSVASRITFGSRRGGSSGSREAGSANPRAGTESSHKGSKKPLSQPKYRTLQVRQSRIPPPCVLCTGRASTALVADSGCCKTWRRVITRGLGHGAASAPTPGEGSRALSARARGSSSSSTRGASRCPRPCSRACHLPISHPSRTGAIGRTYHQKWPTLRCVLPIGLFPTHIFPSTESA
jgi:hypothetical protein